MHTLLKGRGNQSHILGNGQKGGDANGMKKTHLPEISDTCLTLSTTQKMWEVVKQTYPKACDATRVYEIRNAPLLDESKRKSKEKCNNGKDERRTLGTNTSIYLGILVLMPQTHHITSPRSLIWGQLIT